MVENVILIGNISLEIIPACVAGAAYFLLLLLNLTTPMDKNQRVKSLMFSIGGFYLVNIVRLFLFAILITKSVRIFDLTHMATWYFLSTVLVVVIWFAAVKIYKIKKIPIYEDIRFLFSKSLLNSRRKKQK
ncbi:hypothetical protein COV11_03705 [Candidatus Woesearchaeota archaeon CG10_big_fil_rev_8_21_14_0_10_30_7]|nr:MAG: hypothetical protein COV11_03705 [Candidatus Woesearchaeota archaeon CG10_big_fil_rev_8_21_14_0_10_30_7]